MRAVKISNKEEAKIFVIRLKIRLLKSALDYIQGTPVQTARAHKRVDLGHMNSSLLGW